MNQKAADGKPGIVIDVGTIGLAVTNWKGHEANYPDFEDCVPAIEPCGDDVFELWFHVEGHQSVCLLADKVALERLGRALSALVDSRDIVSNGGVADD